MGSKQKIIEEFEKKFYRQTDSFRSVKGYEEVKVFLEETIESLESDWKKKVEGLRKIFVSDFELLKIGGLTEDEKIDWIFRNGKEQGYNKALDDLLKEV